MTPDSVPSQLQQAARERQAKGLAIAQTLSAAGHMTFTRAIRDSARQWPDNVALVFGKRSVTYREMLARVDHARQALADSGVAPGQCVALLLNNSDHYIVWYLAILGLGAIAVPLNNRLVAREAAFVLGHSDAVLLVSEGTFGPLLQDVTQERGVPVPSLMLDIADASSCLAAATVTGEPPVEATTPAALYYTSGTTGQPKGVIHTHGGLIIDAYQSAHAWEYDFEGLKMLAVTPLFHIASHTIFLPTLFLGGTLVIDTYETRRTIETIRTQGVNVFFGVPSVLLLITDRAGADGVVLDGVRTVMFGAAPMTISRLAHVQALFPNAGLIHGMGQTESGGTLVTLPSFASSARSGSIGIPLPAVEVAIFDDQDRRLPPGEVGELVARGPNVMLGYFRNVQATQDALRNGWLHTGDLGYQDAEGLVFLVDRKKDMIIRGGENIYSSEVEQVLLKHPRLASVAVVGQRDALFGEQVAAFVVAGGDGTPVPVDELVAHCKKELADYKVPATFRFLPEMPVTATGKIRKAELRDSLPAYERLQDTTTE